MDVEIAPPDVMLELTRLSDSEAPDLDGPGIACKWLIYIHSKSAGDMSTFLPIMEYLLSRQSDLLDAVYWDGVGIVNIFSAAIIMGFIPLIEHLFIGGKPSLFENSQRSFEKVHFPSCTCHDLSAIDYLVVLRSDMVVNPEGECVVQELLPFLMHRSPCVASPGLKWLVKSATRINYRLKESDIYQAQCIDQWTALAAFIPPQVKLNRALDYMTTSKTVDLSLIEALIEKATQELRLTQGLVCMPDPTWIQNIARHRGRETEARSLISNVLNSAYISASQIQVGERAASIWIARAIVSILAGSDTVNPRDIIQPSHANMLLLFKLVSFGGAAASSNLSEEDVVFAIQKCIEDCPERFCLYSEDLGSTLLHEFLRSTLLFERENESARYHMAIYDIMKYLCALIGTDTLDKNTDDPRSILNERDPFLSAQTYYVCMTAMNRQSIDENYQMRANDEFAAILLAHPPASSVEVASGYTDQKASVQHYTALFVSQILKRSRHV